MRTFQVCFGAIALLLLIAPTTHAEKNKKKDNTAKASPVAAPAVAAPAKQDAEERQAAKQAVKKSVSAVPLSKALAISKQIDKLIVDGYKKHKIAPNPMASDELFLRRVYLDAIGRIPTYEEAKAFLDSKEADKRSRLIDRLLDSEGYVSHNFNYWADLLRLQSRMRYAPAAPYLDFVKDSLRDNKPYDQFVRELITAEGYTWDNGAAGYYLRDTGMPLDNMSNTVQVFLGTQLVCAQCHDHPFDSWTQKQYYQLAAFSYGMETRDRSNPLYREVRQMRRSGEVDRNVVRAAGQILRPLAYRVNETDRTLRLPKDYQYSDAKPNDVIDPAAIFGETVEYTKGDSRKEIYAKWMTSPKNPRFSTVIANRLWKRVMGVGVIEPVDDIKDTVEPSNPKLMTYLAEQMVAMNFDMKQYQRVLFNTRTYQREVSVEEIAADEAYYFPGPALRRLSAEQLWDSMLALTIPASDERKGVVATGRYTNGKDLVDKELDEIMSMAKDLAVTREMQIKYRNRTIDLQKKLRVATRTQNREEVNKIREEMNAIRKEIYGADGERMMQRQRSRYQRQVRGTDPRWSGFRRDMVRASEVTSPARPGHFLRQFGQSDRETIENANTEATVPQILTLLNGPMYSQLASRNSVLYKNVAAAESPAEKLDVIVLSILSRRPTELEKKLLMSEVADGGPQGVGNVVWALLNTRQFMFVQ